MTRTVFAAGIYSTVMLLILGGLFVVFGQVRFAETTEFRALFDDVSGLKEGQFVRVSGVEVGKVSSVEYTDGNRIEVTFDVESSYTPTRATIATVRYLNLVGDRYMELSDGPGDATPMAPGETMGTDRTEPALDLDVLIGSFKPLFRALEPEQVNQLSADLITVLQGQGGSVESILVHAASLASSIADRDALVGQVIANLESVLANLATHRDTFDTALDRAHQLASGLAQDSTLLADSVTHIDAAGAEVAALLAELARHSRGRSAKQGTWQHYSTLAATPSSN